MPRREHRAQQELSGSFRKMRKFVVQAELRVNPNSSKERMLFMQAEHTGDDGLIED